MSPFLDMIMCSFFCYYNILMEDWGLGIEGKGGRDRVEGVVMGGWGYGGGGYGWGWAGGWGFDLGESGSNGVI